MRSAAVYPRLAVCQPSEAPVTIQATTRPDLFLYPGRLSLTLSAHRYSALVMNPPSTSSSELVQ